MVYIKSKYYKIKKGSIFMEKYVCVICGYVYDPEVGDPDTGIPSETAFTDLPADWMCPDCGSPLSSFEEE